MGLKKFTCDRCGTDNPGLLTMSKFKTDLCCRVCIEKERKHKDYQKACDAEFKALKQGNYNFKGIGLPDDLK